jgi:hypothetical protein
MTKPYRWEAGKGSKQRPTDKRKYDEGWERIFGKKEKPNENDSCFRHSNETTKKEDDECDST